MARFPFHASARFFVTAAVLLAGAGCALVAGAHPQALSQSPSHTRVSLIADARSVQPGVPFTVGVVLKMDKGWHTYWRNPGESGLATAVTWTLPDGWKAGILRWPIPEKKIESGDILTYGYDGETMLMADITPSAAERAGNRVTIGVHAEWLECERSCIPGEGRGSLSLPVVATVPEADNQAQFKAYLARAPRSAGEAAGVTISGSGSKGEVRIRVVPSAGSRLIVRPGELPDFYPYGDADLQTGRSHVSMEGGSAVISLPVTARNTPARMPPLQGVVVYALEGRATAGAEVSISLAPDAAGPDSVTESSGSLLDRRFITGQPSGGTAPLVLYAVFAVIGGLLLNIMPCVLPVIALKIFGLVKMAGDHPAKVRRLGWAFSGGILATFLVLAIFVLLLKVAGQQVGWGFQFQEPLFVVAMATIVFAFGLSLFGVYEIRLPGAAVTGVSAVIARQEAKGYLASFSEGVFATILATPCTAPFLGSALGFAFSQPAGVVLLIFTCVAFGMSLPYLVLTARPAWLRFMPKPGEWMVTAKQFMGFLMMATFLWLLYVLGKQLGMEAVIWAAAFLLTVGLACWLIGRFATLSASPRTTYITWGSALVVVIAGYLAFVGPVMDARDILDRPAESGAGGTANPSEITWERFSLVELESHLSAGRPVLVDFSAEWCLTCKVNEKTVLAGAEVIRRMQASGIVAVKADWTNRNPEITKLLAKFGRSGVPLYVVFPAGKPNEPMVLPEVITTGILLDAIERATRPS